MLRKWGVRPGDLAAFLALGMTVVVMLILAWCVERLVLRPLVNQADIILFMATFGLTYFLIGFGQLVFGGEPKVMIAEDLYLPKGSYDVKMLGGFVQFQKIDIAAAVIASVMVATLAIFFQKTRIGRALRAVADSHKAALSVGISLEQIWVDRLVRGRHRGARDRHHVGRAIAGRVLAANHRAQGAPGSDPRRLHVDPGRHRRRHHHRRRREDRRVLLGPLLGKGIESWLAYVIALVFLLFRPQGLFGEKIIERI